MSSFMYRDMFPLIKERLDERQRLVLGLRLQGYTLEQVGDVLGGRSKERVREIEAKSWAIILHALKQQLNN